MFLVVISFNLKNLGFLFRTNFNQLEIIMFVVISFFWVQQPKPKPVLIMSPGFKNNRNMFILLF